MAASLNDIIRIVVNQRQAMQVVQNVFWYRVVTLTGLEGPYLEVVRDWMLNEVLPTVWGVQTDYLVYETMNIQNVTNQIDFLDHVFTSEEQPANSDEPLPPYSTLTFRLLRETLVTRNGYKRFAGVREVNNENGVWTGSTAQLVAIQDALAADIQPAPSIVPLLEPVIVRRGSDGAVTAANSIGGSDFRGIGTQITRKIGRGS